MAVDRGASQRQHRGKGGTSDYITKTNWPKTKGGLAETAKPSRKPQGFAPELEQEALGAAALPSWEGRGTVRCANQARPSTAPEYRGNEVVSQGSWLAALPFLERDEVPPFSLRLCLSYSQGTSW